MFGKLRKRGIAKGLADAIKAGRVIIGVDLAKPSPPQSDSAIAMAYAVEGLRRRDEGTEAVMKNRPVFKALVAGLIDELCDKKTTITAEVVQTEFLARYPGCPPPHPNAWGAAILGASKRGKIKATGRYVATMKPASHARRIQVWETVKVAA